MQAIVAFASEPPKGVTDVIDKFKATEKSQGSERTALFADDAVVINAFGGRYEGRARFGELWKGLGQSQTFAESQIEQLDMKYTQLAPNLWLADYVEMLTGQRGPKSRRELAPRKIHMTIIVKQESANDWRIVYFRAGDVRTVGDERRKREEQTGAPRD
jgi:ketosteroid isomerase-like protein